MELNDKIKINIDATLNGLQLTIVSLNESLRRIEDDETDQNFRDVKDVRDQCVAALKEEIKRRDPDLQNLAF